MTTRYAKETNELHDGPEGSDGVECRHPELQRYRKSIDNIDAALVFMLAERFKITKQVGFYKREHNLPPGDPKREERQIERLRELAHSADLDPEFSRKFLQFIAREVIRHHERIRDAEGAGGANEAETGAATERHTEG